MSRFYIGWRQHTQDVPEFDFFSFAILLLIMFAMFYFLIKDD